jgi:hypothetical protein
MKKLTLVLTLVVATLVSNGQRKIKIDLEDGLGNIVPMTFVINDTNSVKEYLKNIDLISPSTNGRKTKIEMFMEFANLYIKQGMKNETSYKPIQSTKNVVSYNKEKNRLEVVMTSAAKNGYGNPIEDIHMVGFSNDKNYILGKLIF